MNAQITKENKPSVYERDAAAGLCPVAILDRDGKVLISTLPRVFAPGADLFTDLFPADRRQFAANAEELEATRFFFNSSAGGFFLLTKLALSHGVILAVRSETLRSARAKAQARQYGFEELLCRSGENADSEQITQVGAELSFALELERLFSVAGGTPTLTKRGAEIFFKKFSQLARVDLTVKRSVRKKELFAGVDHKLLGLSALVAAGLSAAFLERAPVEVCFFESADRHSVKVEFSSEIDRQKVCDLPSAEYFEALFGNILAFKCKNLHFYYKDNALCFSLCPAVFDPDAPGLMQGKKLSQKSTGKD